MIRCRFVTSFCHFHEDECKMYSKQTDFYKGTIKNSKITQCCQNVTDEHFIPFILAQVWPWPSDSNAAGAIVQQQVEVFSGNVRSVFYLLKQGAGFGGSEGIIAGRNPHQKRVLGGILEAEVSQIRSGLGHLDPAYTGLKPQLLDRSVRDDQVVAGVVVGHSDKCIRVK